MKLRALLVFSMLGASAGLVLADEEPISAEDPATTAPPAFTGPAVEVVGDWDQIGTRSLVLPMGKMEVHGSLGVVAFSRSDGMGGTTTSTGEVLQLGGTYGVTDKIEAGVDYAFAINEFEIKGPLSLRGAFAAYKKGKLELAVAGSLNILFTTGIDSMLQETTEVNLGLSLGAWVRYQITNKISLFSGQPATPISSLSALTGGFLTLPPIPYQLTFGFNNNGASSLTLPVGVGIQATPEIYGFFSTNLMNIDISNSGNAFIFADYIPVGLGAFYSMKGKLDLGLSYTDDLKSIGDFFIITLTGRYYLK